MIFISIIVFIIMIAVLVITHEFGHFIVAKKAGMKVEEFGFGFPPRIFGIKKGETLYSINWIPLGGFVKIVGEDNTEHSDPRSFVNKGFWWKFATLIAGIFMNFVLAWVLYSIGGVVGLPAEYSPGDQVPAHAVLHSQGVTITDIEKNSPANKAGILSGDIVLNANGKSFDTATNLVAYLKTQDGSTISFLLQRQGKQVTENVQSLANPPAGSGAVGIGISDVGILRYKWYAAPWFGLQQTYYITTSTISGLYGLIRSGEGLSSLGGPVKIAQLTGEVTRLGLGYVIQFTAYLSVNLAILNIIPFPALDGGRILFLLIEKIRRKPNNPKIEAMVNTIGFLVLLALIALISIKDVGSILHK